LFILVYQITKVATNLIWIHGERILIKIHLSIENFSLDIVIHYKKRAIIKKKTRRSIEMYADKKKIEWLLFDSGKSVRSISIESGVPLTTVSDLANKRSSIDNMRFINAMKLNKLAEEIVDINTSTNK
jgi:hypothetical protein